MRLVRPCAVLLFVLCATTFAAAQTPSATPAQPAAAAEKKAEPFAFADFTWLTGNPRTKESPIKTEVFTGEVRFDTNYTLFVQSAVRTTPSADRARSSVTTKSQVTQLGIGGDFHYDNARGRLMTQFGMYSQTTPRNDASPARGQWKLDDAYRYISEAYGGYHWDKMHGINVDAGIFMSYIGLWSYYQFDNWAYQPSYVSSNTPWFFNGVRVQIFPTDKLKIEPWIINGWQSYGKFNKAPGVGGQVAVAAERSISIVGQQLLRHGHAGQPRPEAHSHRRQHSGEVPTTSRKRAIRKAAFTVTFDAGCEYGGGVSCHGGTADSRRSSSSASWPTTGSGSTRISSRLTLGGGAINNPGRYLVLIPPINGATAFSGTPYFTAARATRTRPGTRRSRSTTCRCSS